MSTEYKLPVNTPFGQAPRVAATNADYTQRNAQQVQQQNPNAWMQQAFAPQPQLFTPELLMQLMQMSKMPKQERHIGIGGQNRTGAPNEWSNGTVMTGNGVGGMQKMGTADNPYSWQKNDSGNPMYSGAAGIHRAADHPGVWDMIGRNVAHSRAVDESNRIPGTSFIPNSADVMGPDGPTGRVAQGAFGGGYSQFGEGNPQPATGQRPMALDANPTQQQMDFWRRQQQMQNMPNAIGGQSPLGANPNFTNQFGHLFGSLLA